VLQSEQSDEYAVPFDADLECKTHVVVYDGSTSSLADVCSQCKLLCGCVYNDW